MGIPFPSSRVTLAVPLALAVWLAAPWPHLHAQELQPFLPPTAPAPTPESPPRRAPPPAEDPPVARAVPFEQASPAAAPTPTPPPAPVSPRPRAAATPAAQAVTRRPPPAAPANSPRPAGDSSAGTATTAEDNTIRLAPGQGGGGTTVTPDALALDSANNLYRRDQFSQAAAEYERYLGLFPDAPSEDRQLALWFLGEAYNKLKRLPAAQTTYESLIAKYSEGRFVGPANHRLASIYFDAKNPKAALPLFQRSAALAKDNETILAARYGEALCLENLNRRDETKEVYGEILAVPGAHPYRDTARTALARLAVDTKRPNEALEQYEALAKETTKAPLRADATINAGLLARELGQNDRAAALLERGMKLPEAGPKLAGVAALELLHLYYDTNKYQKLLDAFNAGARNLPEDKRPEAMLLAGNALRQLGRHVEARGIYDSLLTQFSRSAQVPEARYQRIISLYSANDANFVHEADDFLLLSTDPTKSDQVKLMKADTLFKKEDYGAAAVAYSTLEGSRSLPPKYKAEAAYRLGYALVQSRQPDKAIEAFTRFIKAYPEHPLMPKALAQRALAHGQLKGYDAALTDFNDLIANYPQAKEREVALQQKALLLGQRENTRGMTDAFRTLLKEYPKTDAAGQAHFFLGGAAYEARDFVTARKEFEAARQSSPKEYGPRAALRTILCDYQLQDKAGLAADVDAYHKAKLTPEVPATALRWLGERQFEDKDYLAAEPNLALAAASPTNDAPDTWLKLARCRLLLKRADTALNATDEFLKRAATDPSARANGLLTQGEAQLALKKYDDAQKSTEEALQLAPEGPLNARARLLSGDVTLARGDSEAAAKTYLSLAILTDDAEVTPLALRRAADALDKAGKPAEAAKARNELKARFPNGAAQG